MRFHELAASALPLSLLACACASAQQATSSEPSAQTLDTLEINAHAIHYPASSASIDKQHADAAINAVDVEDMAKYLPGVFVRKRNYGDTQPVLATRAWGVNSSARTLVFVDDVPISALIANNNTLGAPRWGMVAPEQVDHIDMLYGAYSARYSGNAVGGVMNIATRLPDKFELSLRQTEAVQHFDQYGINDDYRTHQTSITVGDRVGKLAWFVGANWQDSQSQPLSHVTAGKPPADTTGAIAANNKTGQAADVLGAGGLLDTRQWNLDGTLAYDFTPWLHATYRLGVWHDAGQSRVDTFLRNADGDATFAGSGGFASNRYLIDAAHRMQALSLKTDGGGAFDGALVATRYDFLRDRQLSPTSADADGTGYDASGRDADNAGTGWKTLDVQGVWRSGANELAAGAHADTYTLDGNTWNTTAWRDAASRGAAYSAGNGETRTHALWLEDTWRFAPQWQAVLGAREEHWQARDGYNFANGVAVTQPKRADSAFSPKFNLQWDFAPRWSTRLSLAKAVRFPTVGELYQLVTTGDTALSPDPDLKPETARSGEWSFERTDADSDVRVSLFRENMRDAIISQTAWLDGVATPVAYNVNVGEVRNRGIELAGRKSDALVDGLELSASVTFVDSDILSNDGFASGSGTTSAGKRAPYVPRWRAGASATWRPDDNWAFTLSGRYSGRQYSTLDNTDATPRVFGAFDAFTVFDARVQRKLGKGFTAALGIDNLFDEKYFLYHPFPQRTFVFDVRWAL